MKKMFLVFTSLFVLLRVIANDSTKTLSLNYFLQIVKQFHPVAKQANIIIDKANAGLTIARSSFDPLLSSSGSNKTFDGTSYYQSNTSKISIPTWYGIEVTTGIEYLIDVVLLNGFG